MRRHQIQWRNLTALRADTSSWKREGKQWKAQMLLQEDLAYRLPAPSWAWLRADASHICLWSQSHKSHAGWDPQSLSAGLQMQNVFSLGFERMFFKLWAGNGSLDLFSTNFSVSEKQRSPNDTLICKYFPAEEHGAPCLLLTTGSDNWVFRNTWKPPEFFWKVWSWMKAGRTATNPFLLWLWVENFSKTWAYATLKCHTKDMVASETCAKRTWRMQCAWPDVLHSQLSKYHLSRCNGGSQTLWEIGWERIYMCPGLPNKQNWKVSFSAVPK